VLPERELRGWLVSGFAQKWRAAPTRTRDLSQCWPRSKNLPQGRADRRRGRSGHFLSTGGQPDFRRSGPRTAAADAFGAGGQAAAGELLTAYGRTPAGSARGGWPGCDLAGHAGPGADWRAGPAGRRKPGTVAVIAPTRIQYQEMIQAVRYMPGFPSEFLNFLQFDLRAFSGPDSPPRPLEQPWQTCVQKMRVREAGASVEFIIETDNRIFGRYVKSCQRRNSVNELVAGEAAPAQRGRNGNGAFRFRRGGGWNRHGPP